MAKNRSGLSEADLQEARNRAVAAGELPESVCRELLLAWHRMDSLPKELRKLAAYQPELSGWAVSHLVPKLCEKLAAELRRNDSEASYKMAAKFELVAEFAETDTRKALDLLLTPGMSGKGSRAAAQANANLLRVLDLGIIGLSYVAAVYARTLGVLDISVSLVADGHLTIRQSIEVASSLDMGVLGYQTDIDDRPQSNHWLPSELFSPKDFNTTGVESIPSRRK
jgi:hypothetical protein